MGCSLFLTIGCILFGAWAVYLLWLWACTCQGMGLMIHLRRLLSSPKREKLRLSYLEGQPPKP